MEQPQWTLMYVAVTSKRRRARFQQGEWHSSRTPNSTDTERSHFMSTFPPLPGEGVAKGARCIMLLQTCYDSKSCVRPQLVSYVSFIQCQFIFQCALHPVHMYYAPLNLATDFCICMVCHRGLYMHSPPGGVLSFPLMQTACLRA